MLSLPSPKNPARRLSKPSIVVVGAVFILLASILIQAHTNAAPNKPITYDGITISPAIIKIALQPGQDKHSFPITVRNDTNAAADITLSTEDFKSLNETGGLALINTGGNATQHKYGLASWLELSTTNIHLDPKQTAIVTATINNRPDLSPGGHYAAILFRSMSKFTNRGVTHIPVNQVISSLVFVQKVGGEKYGLALERPSIPLSWLNLPDHIGLRFKNTGNIQETPYGVVIIRDVLGREVSRGLIQTGSSLILPESQRFFRTGLFNTSRAWLPGVYTATAYYHADNQAAQGQIRTIFWYINLKFLAIASSLILLFGIVVWKSTILLRSRRQNKKA